MIAERRSISCTLGSALAGYTFVPVVAVRLDGSRHGRYSTDSMNSFPEALLSIDHPVDDGWPLRPVGDLGPIEPCFDAAALVFRQIVEDQLSPKASVISAFLRFSTLQRARLTSGSGSWK